MERLKLNLDAEIGGERRTYVVQVPYQDGIVATSEFCPTELLAGNIDLMAALRGETLDAFMAHCRLQLAAMSRITDVSTELDRHIGALMAVLMDHLGRKGKILFGDLLIYIDCFSILLKSAGFDSLEIKNIYPRVALTIVELYPQHVISTGEGDLFVESADVDRLRSLAVSVNE